MKIKSFLILATALLMVACGGNTSNKSKGEEAQVDFMLVALRESGYPLDLSYAEECDGDIGDKIWFDFSDGKFSSFDRCVQGERASISTYHTLRKCAGLTYDEDALAGGRKRALRLLKAFLCEKTEEKYENLGEFLRLYEE